MRLKWGIQPEQKYGGRRAMGIPRERREGWDLPALEEEEGEKWLRNIRKRTRVWV